MCKWKRTTRTKGQTDEELRNKWSSHGHACLQLPAVGDNEAGTKGYEWHDRSESCFFDGKGRQIVGFVASGRKP